MLTVLRTKGFKKKLFSFVLEPVTSSHLIILSRHTKSPPLNITHIQKVVLNIPKKSANISPQISFIIKYRVPRTLGRKAYSHQAFRKIIVTFIGPFIFTFIIATLLTQNFERPHPLSTNPNNSGSTPSRYDEFLL